MLAREGHPYVVGFLLLLFPSVVSLFALGFFDRFAWLRETQLIYQLLIAVGALVCLLGGIWAAVQDHLGRQMGYAIVFEIGLSLIALGLGGHQAVQLTFALIISRTFSLLIWAIALSGLRQATVGSLRMSDVRYVARRHPLLLSGLVLAIFSFAGLPLSAGFAPKFTLLVAVWTKSSLAGAATLLGAVGLLVAGIRVLFALTSAPLSSQSDATDGLSSVGTADTLLPDSENPFTWLYLVVGGGGLVLMGLLPQMFYGDLAPFLSVFSQLMP